MLREVFRLGAEADLWVVPHRGAEVWGLHAIAALSPAPLAESGRPWVTWLRGEPRIERGMVRPTDAPGFGVDSTPPHSLTERGPEATARGQLPGPKRPCAAGPECRRGGSAVIE